MNTPLYINRLSLSHTNKEKNDALIVLCSVTFAFSFVYQNNENLIYYSSTIKGSLFIFFSLFLSLTLFTMINKKLCNPVCSVIELLSTYSFFTESKTHIMLDTFFYDVILMPFVVENVVYVTKSFYYEEHTPQREVRL
jgi:hypothetical protein